MPKSPKTNDTFAIPFTFSPSVMWVAWLVESCTGLSVVDTRLGRLTSLTFLNLSTLADVTFSRFAFFIEPSSLVIVFTVAGR